MEAASKYCISRDGAKAFTGVLSTPTQRGHQAEVKEQCKVCFQIGPYHDEVVSDVVEMDACHLLLGRPWQFDRDAVYHGKKQDLCNQERWQ